MGKKCEQGNRYNWRKGTFYISRCSKSCPHRRGNYCHEMEREITPDTILFGTLFPVFCPLVKTEADIPEVGYLVKAQEHIMVRRFFNVFGELLGLTEEQIWGSLDKTEWRSFDKLRKKMDDLDFSE